MIIYHTSIKEMKIDITIKQTHKPTHSQDGLIMMMMYHVFRICRRCGALDGLDNLGLRLEIRTFRLEIRNFRLEIRNFRLEIRNCKFDLKLRECCE